MTQWGNYLSIQFTMSLAEAGDRIAERLRGLLQVQAERPDVPVPSCLLGCINQSVFTCKICSEPYDNIHKFVEHGKIHTGSGSLACSWCGEEWRSYVSLTIHQLVYQGQAGGKTEKEHQGGGKTEKKRPSIDKDKLTCPLSCGDQPYSVKNLKVHLQAFHGCEPGNISVVKDDAGHVDKVDADLGVSGVECYRCETRINTSNVSLEHHIILECFARSPIVQQEVTGLTQLCDEQEIDALDLVQMELESHLNYWTNLLNCKAGNTMETFLREGYREDSKYSRLPKHFSKDCLAWLPRRYTLEVFESEQHNLLLLFDVWCQVIERLYSLEPDLQETMIRINKEIQNNVSSGNLPEWEEMDSQDLGQFEDQETINKLEIELGWKDRQPVFFGGGDLNDVVRDIANKRDLKQATNTCVHFPDQN